MVVFRSWDRQARLGERDGHWRALAGTVRAWTWGACRPSDTSQPGVPQSVATMAGMGAIGEVRWAIDGVSARRLLTWYVVSRRRTVTVGEIVGWLDEVGLAPAGRVGKAVSDKLRADVARGRVRRVGRGAYAAGDVPPSTWRRIESSARRSLGFDRSLI